MTSENKLLGSLSFVSRTFEGSFGDSPYVLDMDANLYIGPADDKARNEHSAIEVVFHFLRQTNRIDGSLRDLAKDRRKLLDAFATLDEARSNEDAEEFRIFIFGTYDGDMLVAVEDDELPAGPCGVSVNSIKRHFYEICRRMDREFESRELTPEQRKTESYFVLA